VIRGLVEEYSDVLIIERVKREPAIAPVSHGSGCTEQAEVVRDRRFRQSHDRGDIAHAELVRRQGRDNAKSRRISERREERGEAIEVIARRERLLRRADGGEMNHVLGTNRNRGLGKLFNPSRPRHPDSPYLMVE
jgi:hypothetical protein